MGSLITHFGSYWVAKQSVLVLSQLLLLLMQRLIDHQKSPVATTKKKLLQVIASKFNSKSSRNESKLSAV